MTELLVDKKVNYKFLKFIELFEKIQADHQRSFLTYFAEEYKESAPRWGKMLEREDYFAMVRSILFYFSGHEKVNQPSPEDLVKAMTEYTKSSYFKEAEAGAEAEDFMEEMEAI